MEQYITLDWNLCSRWDFFKLVCYGAQNLVWTLFILFFCFVVAAQITWLSFFEAKAQTAEGRGLAASCVFLNV